MSAVLVASGLVKDHPGPRPHALARRSVVHAVAGVDLELAAGETLGLVGESGSGKSTLAGMLVGRTAPTRGTVEAGGHRLPARGRPERLAACRTVQLVHQDPLSALDPRWTAGASIAEPFSIHPGLVPKARRRARVGELLELVGLDPDHADRLPARFSGGQRQRLLLARALAVEPAVLVLDEPVSGLDVSVQGQVVNLLTRLQRELGLAMVFITHDLTVVGHVAHRIAVMHEGRIVEQGPAEQVLTEPRDAYTRRLRDAAPRLERTRGGTPIARPREALA